MQLHLDTFETLETKLRSIAMLPPRAVARAELVLEREMAIAIIQYAKDLKFAARPSNHWLSAGEDEDEAVA